MAQDDANRLTTMNISLPESLREFVQRRLSAGFGSESEYVRQLIREDQERLERQLLEESSVKGLEERRFDAEAVSEAVAGIRELREELRSQGRLSSLDDIRAAIDEGRM
ncbi:MAG TPA: type II toxin-antitoxin system ParD family antitoxin [Planctomycetota bacterium]|nr:type II toxin-antitoxin system ParD family antitoxin [Planctomycetota bacterium]